MVSQKGFIITVDSFLGVTLILLLCTLSFFFISKVSLTSWNSIDLRNSVLDSASIIEKSLSAEESLLQSSSEEILGLINDTPDNYCFEVSILSSELAIYQHTQKSGCTKLSDEIFTAERTIPLKSESGTSFYILHVEGWLK